MDPERNDVDISRLFKWGKIFSLSNADGEVISTVYMRLIGDADLNKARVYALRRSAEYRKKLKTENSDERFAYIQDKVGIDYEQIVSINLILNTREVTQEANDELVFPLPKEPKASAKLETLEKYQKEIDDYPAKREEALRTEVTKRLKVIETYLREKSFDELYKQYEMQMINELCEQEMISAFKEMCVYFGCFKDPGFSDRYFSSLDEYLNLERYIKQQFMDAYLSIEIPSGELKKLQEVTL